MKRRKRLLPDTRPKWDDPDLRVAMRGDNPEGISAEALQRAAKHSFINADRPLWRGDPTYNLRRQPKD